MANSKITALTALTGANSAPLDLLTLVDVSDATMAASGTNKSITRQELQTYNAGTLTTDVKVLDLSVTWNAAGVTFTGLKFNATNTASAAASKVLDIQLSTVSKLSVGVTSSLLIGDTDNIVEIRNSTTAQTLHLYNTFTNASNYERGFLKWSSNVLEFGNEAAGTGTGRANKYWMNNLAGSNAYISYEGSHKIILGSAGSDVWVFSNSTLTIKNWSSGQDRAIILNSQAGITDRASEFVRIDADNGSGAGAIGGFYVRTAPALGTGTTAHPLEESFRVRTVTAGEALVSFGGTAATFPALKRSATALHARLADDSAYAPFSAELVTVAAGTATPAAGSTAARLLFGTTAGFGIYYGSGAPTVSAAKGSLYLRSDGTGAADRAYINTDAGTTWTAIATAG